MNNDDRKLRLDERREALQQRMAHPGQNREMRRRNDSIIRKAMRQIKADTGALARQRDTN
jgi:hypothetical protein